MDRNGSPQFQVSRFTSRDAVWNLNCISLRSFASSFANFAVPLRFYRTGRKRFAKDHKAIRGDAEIAQASREFIGNQDVTENMMREQAVDTMQVRRITLPDGRYLIFYTFDRESPDRAAQKIETSEHSEDKPPSQPERG